MGADSAMDIVLLHAFPLHAAMWEYQRQGLGRVFRRVLTPDMPGFGGAALLTELTMASAADAVLAYMDAAGVERCVLGGLSMGGYVAFQCLRQFPQRIAGLILAHTRAAPDDPDTLKARYAAIDRIRFGGYAEYCQGMVQRLLCASTLSQGAQTTVPAVQIMMADNSPESAMAALAAMAARPDSTDTLRSISVPLLLVSGREDIVTPAEEARAMSRQAIAAPSVKLVVIPDAGHLSNLEQPDAFNAAVEQWWGEVIGDL